MGRMKEAYGDMYGNYPGHPNYDWVSTLARNMGMPYPEWLEPTEAELEEAHIDLARQQLEAKCTARDAKA